LIMTHDHAEDAALCDAALRTPGLASIGLIGSAAKWARFRRRLAEEGHADEAIDRITTPIGLPGLAGKDPSTIAISVAAALVGTLEREQADAPLATGAADGSEVPR
jgi:xanthine dehydrogenase accessory factor